jgi:TatD DNase family protein
MMVPMMIRMFDTHCHPQFPQYDEDRDTVIQRTLESGIGMICVGTDATTSEQAIALAEKYEGLYASVGWHPNDDLGGEQAIESFIPYLERPKVVAVGEVGLDHYRTPGLNDRRRQAHRFKQFQSAAMEARLPLIIHCRDAHGDMLDLLDRDVPSVIHSFNGDTDTARKYLDCGCMIGLNAIVTYSSSYHDMVRMVPNNRILIETDAPYLAPVPYRGKRNEPSYAQLVAEAIAAMKNAPVDEFIYVTTENARRFFALK